MIRAAYATRTNGPNDSALMTVVVDGIGVVLEFSMDKVKWAKKAASLLDKSSDWRAELARIKAGIKAEEPPTPEELFHAKCPCGNQVT